MKENWSSDNFCRFFPRKKKVAFNLAAMHILRCYFVVQIRNNNFIKNFTNKGRFEKFIISPVAMPKYLKFVTNRCIAIDNSKYKNTYQFKVRLVCLFVSFFCFCFCLNRNVQQLYSRICHFFRETVLLKIRVTITLLYVQNDTV